MARVLSSEEARTAITQMQTIINGGLTEQIHSLDVQGQRLSDPNVWDGKLAMDFRARWPETKWALIHHHPDARGAAHPDAGDQPGHHGCGRQH